jgi:hypothetical protein
MDSLELKRFKLTIVGAFAVGVAVLLGGTSASACNTPVYRYAMYNWRVSPYPIFYLYNGEEPEEDKKTNKLIEELSTSEAEIANVVLEKIDVSDAEKLDKLPGWEVIEKAWKSYNDGAVPAHLVMTPWGAKVFAGRLDEKAVKALVESPARTRLGELLNQGNAAVMIFLSGADETENKRAEKALDELIAKSQRNEIPMALDFSDPATMGAVPPDESGDGENAEDADPAAKPPGLRVAKLKIDRSDPAELWFVRALMTLEPDLHEYAKEPMIFAGYGRGRAMEPYIGKGITPDNLVDVVAFLAGACSCMVKEQNPGADLLVKWDWEATADLMAADDSTLDPTPYGYQEFSPAAPATDESSQAMETQPAARTAEPKTDTLAAADPATAPDPPADTTSSPDADGPIGESANEGEPATTPATGDDGQDMAADTPRPEPQPAANAKPADDDVNESYAGRQTKRLIMAFAAVAACLVMVTLVVMLRRA